MYGGFLSDCAAVLCTVYTPRNSKAGCPIVLRPLLLLCLVLCSTGLAKAQTNHAAPAQLPEDSNPVAAANPMPPTYAPIPGATADNPSQGRLKGPVRISGGVMAGRILTRVDPVYPAEAKSQGVQGSVVLAAAIGRDGRVQDLQVISGPPALATAALIAVRQWTYSHYLLNGSPTPVQTTVTVNFSLSPPPEPSL